MCLIGHLHVTLVKFIPLFLIGGILYMFDFRETFFLGAKEYLVIVVLLCVICFY